MYPKYEIYAKQSVIFSTKLWIGDLNQTQKQNLWKYVELFFIINEFNNSN